MLVRFFLVNSFLFLLLISSSFAQKRNLDAQMRDFLNTPFMVEYQKLQLNMRGLVKDFIADKEEYSTADLRKVRDAYNLTSRSFNEVLYTIEADMLNKYTRRTMARNPDLYYSKLQLQMGHLKDIYAREFLQTLADVRSEPVSGGLSLIAVTTLTQLTASIVDFFLKARMQSVQFNQAFVRDRLVRPYSFPNWDQIAFGNSAGQWANGSYQNGNTGNYGDINQNNNGNGNGQYQNGGNYGGYNDGNYGGANNGSYGNNNSNYQNGGMYNNENFNNNGNSTGSPIGSRVQNVLEEEAAKEGN